MDCQDPQCAVPRTILLDIECDSSVGRTCDEDAFAVQG
jgi:hypothetical protein